MDGTGKVRRVPKDKECGHCHEVIKAGSDFVWWHKVQGVIRWMIPVHVKCHEELSE